jgi:hypothetical protein
MAFKVTDEMVFSATQQADDALSLPLLENTTYMVEGYIVALATNASPPNIQIMWNVPSQSTMSISFVSGGASQGTSRFGVLDFNGQESDNIVLGAGLSNPVHVMGTVFTSTTSGNLSLFWAQDATVADEPVTVRRGSNLKVTRVNQ